jgi:hypothetical protein
MSSPGLVLLTGPQDFEITCAFALNNTMVAGQIIPAVITAFGPFVPAAAQVQLPITEVWHVVDIYTVGAPVGPDAFIQLFLNGYQQQINPKISSVNLNLITRFQLQQTLVFAPASTVSVSIVLLAAPVGAVTQLLTLKTIKAPYTG